MTAYTPTHSSREEVMVVQPLTRRATLSPPRGGPSETI